MSEHLLQLLFEGNYIQYISQGCSFGAMAPQVVPEQLIVASSTKFLVPGLGSCCMIHIY